MSFIEFIEHCPSSDKKWRFHTCGALSLDADCREFGTTRFNINTPWTHVMVQYWPSRWWPNKDWLKFIRENGEPTFIE